MAIKKVFGAIQGDKSKRCTFVGEYKEGNLWLVDSELAVCLEKDGLLYRIGNVGMCKWSEAHRRSITTLSKESLDRYKKAAEDCAIIPRAKLVCGESYQASLKEVADLGCDEKLKTTPANAAFFYLADMVKEYETVMSNNEKVRAHNAAIDEAKEAEALAREEEEKQNKLDSALNALLSGGNLEADALLILCDKFKVNVPLRTRGWIIEKLVSINDKDMSWQPKKKTDRPSTKVFSIYRQLQEVAAN